MEDRPFAADTAANAGSATLAPTGEVQGRRVIRRLSILHPATELVLLLCALVLTYGIPSPIVPAALLIAATTVAACSPRVRFRRWGATVAVLAVPMLVMIGLIQGLFYPGDDLEVLWRWGAAALTVEGISVAVQLWLRVTAMIALCALFAFGTDSARTFDGMIRLRLPLGIAYVCATALSLIPMLRDQVSHALLARAARGWNTERLSTRVRLMPGIIGGLLTASLVQLDQRHDTLEQRGFGRSPRPAELQDHPDGTAQRVLRWGAPISTVLLVIAALLGVVEVPTASELLGVLRG